MVREPSPAAEGAAREVVDAAIAVHRALGPGLRESHYREALVIELRARGRSTQTEVQARVKYGGADLRKRLYLDLVVDDVLVVEVKAVDRLHPNHVAQASSYLAATGRELALLLNFSAPRMKDGIRRVVRTR